jgi:hypothetical protein
MDNKTLMPVNTGLANNQIVGNELLARMPLFKEMTPNGKDFFMRALHPNDDTRGGGVMIPDAVTVDRAVSEARLYQTISKPSYITSNNWDIQLVVLSCIDVPIIYRTRPSGTSGPDSWSLWNAIVDNNTLSPGVFRLESGDTPPAVIKTPQLLLDATQFRQGFRGLTVVLDASAMYNQGFVTAGQWGNKAKEVPIQPSKEPATEVKEITHLVFDDVPSEVGEIIQLCPESGQWEARKGIYMPMRFEDPVHEFNGGSENEWYTPASGFTPATYAKSGHIIVLQRAGQPDSYVRNILWSDVDNNLAITTAGSVNQAFGSAIFTGIDARANLVLHTRSGLEVEPTANSPAARYTQKNKVEDPCAIKAVTAVSAQLPVVYEHKYNSLGMLLPLIGKVASTVLPTVAPWIASKVGQGAQWVSNRLFGRRQYQEPSLD